jgi:hypothetical protein
MLEMTVSSSVEDRHLMISGMPPFLMIIAAFSGSVQLVSECRAEEREGGKKPESKTCSSLEDLFRG